MAHWKRPPAYSYGFLCLDIKICTTVNNTSWPIGKVPQCTAMDFFALTSWWICMASSGLTCAALWYQLQDKMIIKACTL